MPKRLAILSMILAAVVLAGGLARMASAQTQPNSCAPGSYATLISSGGLPTCAQVGFSEVTGVASPLQGGLGLSALCLDDQVPVSNGLAYVCTLIPECLLAQKLQYTAATGLFSCTVDQTGVGSGATLTRILGSSGAAGTDFTTQRLILDSATCSTTALCASVMTTTNVGLGVWKFRYTIYYQSTATTTGIGFGVNHTGTATTAGITWSHITTGGAAANGIGDNVAATVAGQLREGKSCTTLNSVCGSASAGVAVVNTNVQAVIEGVLNVTLTGSLELKIASEVGGSNVRVQAGSVLELIAL